MITKIFNYYILKESIKYIDPKVSSFIEIDDLFNHALFPCCDYFYSFLTPFKANKYNISQTALDSKYFKDYIKTCLNSLNSKENSFLCYYLLANYLINRNIKEYIDVISNNNPKKYEVISRSIDAYYFDKMENKHINSVNLVKYFHIAPKLTPGHIEVFEFATKKILGFFCYKKYYDKCYHNIDVYFKNHVKKNIFKSLFYSIYDIFNHRKGNLKAKYFNYSKKYNIKHLNLKNDSYNVNDYIYVNSINDVYKNTLIEIELAYKNLNHYFNGDKNRFFNYLNTLK